VDALLALLLCDKGSLVLGESSADGTGLLGSEVEREVLLVLVEETQLGALVGLDDGQDAGDGLAQVVAVKILSQLLFLIPLSQYFVCRIRHSLSSVCKSSLLLPYFAALILLLKSFHSRESSPHSMHSFLSYFAGRFFGFGFFSSRFDIAYSARRGIIDHREKKIQRTFC
jgi:hypothetical protein